ncbi:Putative ammonia monooxygenase [Listeria grayi]|uniref:Ammonia monooxygenase n=1 Tax=Listeria grayi TaxID=1641 RepID=A0A378MNN9_LISGR|nr:Putative ammonia monooxygenase [Listeria grayi]
MLNTKQLPIKKTVFPFLLTILAGLAGAGLAMLIHLPIPWLLGPMLIITILNQFDKIPLHFPAILRLAALMIVGYTAGTKITLATFKLIISQLPIMVITTIVLILIGILFSYFISKWTTLDYQSLVAGSMPGGATQMILYAREQKHLDPTIVSIFQIFRLVTIFLFVPIILYTPLIGAHHQSQAVATHNAASDYFLSQFPWASILFFLIAVLVFSDLGRFLRLPIHQLLGPLLGIGILNIFGIHGFNVPHGIIGATQLALGIYFGLGINLKGNANKATLFISAIISNIVLLFCMVGISLLLNQLFHYGETTAYLAIVPGGMDQISLIATTISANVGLVVGYQTFRSISVNLIAPFVFKHLLQERNK